MTFSIAHATARPNGWQSTCRGALLQSRDVEYVLSYDSRFGDFGDLDKLDKVRNCKTVSLPPSEQKCAVSNWINAINHTTGDVILVNSDDFSFPMYWDRDLEKVIGDRDPLTKPFVVQVSTGGPRDSELMTIQIFSRALLNHWGYGLWHEYDGMYVDDDYSQHAFTDPVVEVIQARHLMFEHLHFSFGKSDHDEVYAHENRQESIRLGAEIFHRRRSTNFK